MKVLVEADGGSRGNPGPAGYGAVVFTADHAAVLAERNEFIGLATNNVAEYRGLIAGLEAAAAAGADEVSVAMDSKLVVEQMSGRWRVKHPDLVALQQEASALAAGFDRISYTWIPRAQNTHADRLANEAMDAADGRADAKPAPADKLAAPGWTGATGAPTRLLLLRHGETELSIERRYSGRGNPALTGEGHRQADAAARSAGALQDADHAGLADATMDLDPPGGELLGDDVGRPDLLEADLGMGVEIAADGDELVREGQDLGQGRHGDSGRRMGSGEGLAEGRGAQARAQTTPGQGGGIDRHRPRRGADEDRLRDRLEIGTEMHRALVDEDGLLGRLDADLPVHRLIGHLRLA